LVSFYVNDTKEVIEKDFIKSFLHNILSINNKRFILKTIDIEKKEEDIEGEE